MRFKEYLSESNKNKEEIFNSKKGKKLVSPKGKTYDLDWIKEGNKYIFKITLKGHTMKMPESDFTRFSIDDILDMMIRDMEIK